MKVLNESELLNVNGGHPILVAIGIWGAAVEIYDFGRGVYDGMNE